MTQGIFEVVSMWEEVEHYLGDVPFRLEEYLNRAVGNTQLNQANVRKKTY